MQEGNPFDRAPNPEGSLGASGYKKKKKKSYMQGRNGKNRALT
jgi:hypothetical protein